MKNIKFENGVAHLVTGSTVYVDAEFNIIEI
jgi:hypothetical protein